MKIYLLVILFFSFCIADDYKSIYYEGFAKFNDGDYKAASVSFEKAYSLSPHAQIAYYAAYSFYKLEQEEKCITYAKKALNSSPPLGRSYQENLDYFLRYWDAKKEIGQHDIKIKITLSHQDKTIIAKKDRSTEKLLSLEDRMRLMDDFKIIYHGIPHSYEFYSLIRKTVQDTSRHYNTGYHASGHDPYGDVQEEPSELYFLFPIDSLRGE